MFYKVLCTKHSLHDLRSLTLHARLEGLVASADAWRNQWPYYVTFWDQASSRKGACPRHGQWNVATKALISKNLVNSAAVYRICVDLFRLAMTFKLSNILLQMQWSKLDTPQMLKQLGDRESMRKVSARVSRLKHSTNRWRGKDGCIGIGSIKRVNTFSKIASNLWAIKDVDINRPLPSGDVAQSEAQRLWRFLLWLV